VTRPYQISEVFVVGDTASLDQDGKPLAASLKLQCNKDATLGIDSAPACRQEAAQAFCYFDKGTMAVAQGVRSSAKREIRLHGLFAWLDGLSFTLRFCLSSV